MSEDELIAYYSSGIPVDEDLLAPLGLMSWAAIRLHHAVRDTIGLDLGDGLTDQPFEFTLGRAMTELVKAAERKGDPWASAIGGWRSGIGQRALQERNRLTHATAYTAEDGKQALMTASTERGRERITAELLARAAGLLTLASVELDHARESCRKESCA